MRRRRAPEGQVDMGLANPSAPRLTVVDGREVVDRSTCPKERPCPLYSCRHHLWVDDERPGRPHNGLIPPPKLRKRKLDSCALDLIDKHGEVSAEVIAQQIGITSERVNEIEDRALAKVGTATVLEDWIESLRPKLPAGATIETIYPVQEDPDRIVVEVVMRVDGDAWRKAKQGAGVFVRRKR